MEYRTTFALDAETIRRLKKLAAAWHVSQAEVVRRALEQTEAECDAAGDLPLRRLGEYHRQGGLASEEAAKYLSYISEQRSDWGRGE